ncbi:MAG: hypothetical protein JOZ07_14500 [Solirubrobacterales bacterium]|nr:hypothetical protein [Solirubrobacterales bacterium]
MSGADTRAAPSAVQRFFDALLTRDAAGGSWLRPLLAATPYGPATLGELVEAPGWLQSQLAVRGAEGRLGCFDYPTAPSPALEAWFIDHPSALTWPPGARMSTDALRLRRALIDDDPPGSQARAQERAHELQSRRSALSREWWRFEAVTRLDCVLITDRLAITVQAPGGDRLEATTEWYPPRSQLHRGLEAARRLADGKRFASLVLSRTPLPGADAATLARELPAGAPHLDELERRELADAYLGNLTWQAAAAAVGVEP